MWVKDLGGTMGPVAPEQEVPRGTVGYHLLYTGLQASKCLSGRLQPLLCSPGVSSRLSQHPLNAPRSALGPGSTFPERRG